MSLRLRKGNNQMNLQSFNPNVSDWLSQLFCSHPHEFWSTETTPIRNCNGSTAAVQRRVLVCNRCGKIHRISQEFTLPSGVFARISTDLRSQEHWKEQEAQYRAVAAYTDEFLHRAQAQVKRQEGKK